MLRTHENADIFNTFDEIYLVLTSKNVNILYILHIITPVWVGGIGIYSASSYMFEKVVLESTSSHLFE